VLNTQENQMYMQKSDNTSLEKTASDSISLFEADTKMYLYPHLTPTQLHLPQGIWKIDRFSSKIHTHLPHPRRIRERSR
jgi:hypothetical protein